MPVPTQSLYPFYKATLTADNLRLLQSGIAGFDNFVLIGLDVLPEGDKFRVTSGICVMQGVLIYIQQDVLLSQVDNGEICVHFVYQDALPPPQAEIDCYPVGSSTNDPQHYLLLAEVVDSTLVFDNRKIHPIGYIASPNTPPDSLASINKYWIAPQKGQPLRIYKWTGSSWDVEWSAAHAMPKLVTSDYTIEDGVEIVLVDASANEVEVTLQSSFTRLVRVKKVDTTDNRVTITPATGTIDGLPSVELTTPYESLTLVYDGENWWIV